MAAPAVERGGRDLQEIGDIGFTQAMGTELAGLFGIERPVGIGVLRREINPVARARIRAGISLFLRRNREISFFLDRDGSAFRRISKRKQYVVTPPVFRALQEQGICARGTGNLRGHGPAAVIQPSGEIGFEGVGTNHDRSHAMTDHKVESSREGASAKGYGQPPAEHRFRKGQSGNPAGRPPRRGTGAPGDRLPGAHEPTRAMILEEAYRPVTVFEGEEEITLSTHRAVFRAMAAAAVGGNQTAQHRWTKLVQAAEAQQKRAQIALYNVLERDEREHEWAVAEDSEDWEAPMGPCYDDDIIVDSSSGTVVVRDVGETGEGEK
jgi:hypothetical protein